MYENMTYETILESAIGSIKSDVLKTEGSLVYNALSALAFELEKIYIQMDYIISQADPENADFDNLKSMAAQRAIYPDDATPAAVKIVANVALPIGARFSLSAYNYSVTEELDSVAHTYAAKCEEAGSGANNLFGALIPITYVDGLKSAEITEILTAGSDADGRDELYKKYIESFKSQSFAGNISAYKEKLLSIPGIGGCKVYPVWNGAGTVKLVLQGSDFGVVSDYLIEQVQNEICPDPSTGYGFAPIGHDVTCVSAEEITVNVATSITFSSGYSWDICRDEIRAEVEKYLLMIRKAWGDGLSNEYETVYISRLESAVLDVQGVIDINGTTLNGTGANLPLETSQIPVLGEVANV